jgi:hypothetical protein
MLFSASVSRWDHHTFFRMSQRHKTLFDTRAQKPRAIFPSRFSSSTLGFASCGKKQLEWEKRRVFTHSMSKIAIFERTVAVFGNSATVKKKNFLLCFGRPKNRNPANPSFLN